MLPEKFRDVRETGPRPSNTVPAGTYLNTLIFVLLIEFKDLPLEATVTGQINQGKN